LNPATEEMRLRAKAVADLHFTGDLAHETGPYHPDTEDSEAVSIVIIIIIIIIIYTPGSKDPRG